MLGQHYGEFLTEVLHSARDWGPHNPAIVRQIENGTEKHLLGPARQLEASVTDPDELTELRNATQERLRPIWDRGLFGYEITHWPAGPGSARAMELVYNNNPLPYDVSSHYTEAFLLSRDLAHAVRSRRDVLRDTIVAEIGAHKGAMNVLDLACGPCQSLREALPLIDEPSRLALRGIDMDELAQINNRGYFQRDHRLSWTFEVGNVLKAEFGTESQDLIYSTGLYDYLPSPVLTRLWKRVYASLKPGALAVLSVKDGERFCPLFYRWAINWSQFYIRPESEFLSVMRAAGLPAPEATLRDASGCIIFYLVRKPT